MQYVHGSVGALFVQISYKAYITLEEMSPTSQSGGSYS
ncbi:hypothetical protein F3D3_2782 [Fusibacter sp. 3D3]|nr:hypothetical protein F3D3_2782 [Fusibacter sp. 3D3]